MKAPIRWLSDYTTLPESIDELTYRLTMSGTEVDGITRRDESWSDIVIGLVARLERPEGSRTLNVATLAIGEKSVISVTAAPNIQVGQRVPVVLLGGTVPIGPDGRPFVLKPRPMMGITGEAMVLSERELGISEEHAGIMVLPQDASVGSPLSDLRGGVVLDIEVTANRPDEMSILGIAREVAASNGGDLREPDLTRPHSVRLDPSPAAPVEVLDPDLCPRYTALRVEGIRIRPSPEWITTRLEAAGVRVINNVVDVTNFVMLELGQPLHAFDFRDLAGGRIVVRRASPGETIITLDGTKRTLPPDTLVIADGEKPVAIAGIMGGEHSEVSDDTETILLESANFDRIGIRRSSRRLGLRTESSARFERGVPPELTEMAADRFLNLLASTVEGAIKASALVDVREAVEPLPSIELKTPEMERLLGVEVTQGHAVEALEQLGFAVEESDSLIWVTPPFWRRDVEGSADLAEEIARMIGYDRIPENLPGQDTPPVAAPPDMRRENAVSETLWGIGLSEAWTDTLTSREAMARMFAADSQHDDWAGIIVNAECLRLHQAQAAPMPLVNAPTEERSVLRLSLVPSLVDVLAANLKHTREHLAFFEIAPTFFPRPDDLPYERRTLAIAIAGDREPRTWTRPPCPYDFFDLKGMIAQALGRLGINEGGWSVLPAPTARRNPALHPGRSAVLSVGGTDAGYLGELHPLVAAAFEIEPPVRAYVAEMDLDALIARASSERSLTPVSRFPAVKRDVSVAFPIDVEAAEVRKTVIASGGDLLRHVRIVDVYRAENLGRDRKSIMLSLEFQSDSSTLTQEEASEIQDRIVAALERDLKGKLRT